MSIVQNATFGGNNGKKLTQRRSIRSTWRTLPKIEILEGRLVMSYTCPVISGYVYHDANNNGLYDPGETPIANSTIELHDASNQLVNTAITDSNGFYSFQTDSRIDQTPATKTYTVSFPDKPTDWKDTETLPQFDPSLGTLTSVEIQVQDPMTNIIKIENLDLAPATIHATVNSTATLSGPSIRDMVTAMQVDQSFDAGPFDGTIDFDDPCGHVFGPTTKYGSNAYTLTADSDMAPYIGTGTVSFTESTHASASAEGSANLVLSVNTSVSATVQVIYHYKPGNCLKPGDYTLVQPNVPSGYLNGLKTAGNIQPIPDSNKANYIHITLGTDSLGNNDFGEIKASSLAGFVYHDVHDNGIKDPSDPGIAGVTVNLTGIDDLGQAVTLTQATAADGSYQFSNLRPGTYTLNENHPAGYLDGKDTIGTPGGNTSKDQFSNIQLTAGFSGVNNNFGEILRSSLAGYVYLDPDNNGIKEPGEAGIGGVLVTLTGTDDQGTALMIGQRTAADGSFRFDNLRPGVYTITKTHPNGYIDGKDTIGTPGGGTGPGRFFNIQLAEGYAGTDNDFAELLPVVDPAQSGPPMIGKGRLLASEWMRRG
jgi:hypothetical protein